MGNFFSGVLFVICFYVAFAADPSPLQDLCVADTKTQVLVNGFACKDPNLVQANDFFFTGFNLKGNTSNPYGSWVTTVTVAEVPGLNTLGISMVRIDYAPWGVNPPHIHSRATEILTVLKGILEVGFVTSSPKNRLITRILKEGDVFVFPIGLIHYQRNVRNHSAVAIAALNSQNPGVILIADSMFGSSPDISSDVLGKAFRVDKSLIHQIKAKF